MKRLFFASCVLGLVAASGCGDDDSNAANGASGDEVTLRVDGERAEQLALDSGAMLSLPKGAVSEPVEIGLAVLSKSEAAAVTKLFPDPEAIASAPLRLTPHGTKFDKPVLLTIPIASKHVGRELDGWYLKDDDDDEWKRLDAAQLDDEVAHLELDHFSIVVLADADTEERSDGGAQPGDKDGGQPGANDGGQPDSPDPDAAAAMMDAMTQVETDSGAADAGSAIDAGHAPAVPVPYRVIVLDSPTATRQPNIDVFAFDENGEDFDPPSHGVTDANGEVTLSVPSTGRFALEALGVPNQLVETYDYGVSVAASPNGHSLYLASVLADMRDSEDGDFSISQDAAPVSGGVSWLGSDDTTSTAIGCVTITDDGVMDFRAISQENGRPLPPAERDPALGTVRANGGFILGNVSAGQHTLSAKLPDGTVLDTVHIAIVPRADAATTYGNRYHVQFEINGAPGEDNPTPADCPYP